MLLQTPLSNVQLELLKLYSTNLDEQQMRDLRNILAQFYAQKSIEHANKVWEEKKLSNEVMDKILRN